jgi:HemY protein
MRLWRWILLLVFLAAVAAFGWYWIAADPGYVLVRIRGWEAQTTVLTAAIIVVLAVLVIVALWRLAAWPIGAAGRRQRRLSRKRLYAGLVYLAEGHYAAADRALRRASQHGPQHGAALLAAARAAARRGEEQAARELLDNASASVPLAALSERARLARRAGRPQEAVVLLVPHADHGRLSPAGWLELVKASLAAGEPARARAALKPLRESEALGARDQDALEVRVLVAAIEATDNGAQLKALWGSLSKSVRRRPEVVDAYARRAAGFGQSMAAMGEIEAALKRQWSPPLVATWGMLDDVDVEPRLHRAESWLDTHPDDPVLLSTLGRLSARLQVWGKARKYLGRALDLRSEATTWEALGEVYAGQGNARMAQRCYRNALRMLRHEPVEPLPGGGEEAAPAPAEAPASSEIARDAHGLPHLEGRGARDER